MAYLFLAESEGSTSRLLSGSGRLFTVSESHTLKPSCCPACPAVNWQEPQSGMTCEACPPMILKGESISFTAASPARTSALQALEGVWLASGRDFILKSKELSKKQSQLSSFLRTSLLSGHADLAVWCGDWPSSGMICDGQLFLPRKLEPNTSADAGSCLPTPTAKHYGSNKGGGMGRVGKARHSIHQMATRGLLPGHPKGPLNREYLEQVMGYPSRWTEIADWATQWFRSKRAKRSKDLSDSEISA